MADVCLKCQALLLGHMEVIKLLVSHSADVTFKDKRGYTPLHAAAANGQLEVVKYLLRLGIEVKWLGYKTIKNPKLFFIVINLYSCHLFDVLCIVKRTIPFKHA